MVKYISIERLKDKYIMAFTKGEHITITEKIDGANASIAYDESTKTLRAFSRKHELNEKNTLQGFWGFTRTLDPKLFSILGNKYVIFGEWLVKHTIKYPEDKMKTFYVFDIWNTEIEQYMPWDFVSEMAKRLNLKTVPLFYDGKFTTWEDIYSYVGKTEMGATSGEGIVVKSQDRLDNKSSNTPSYIKIVAKEFSEVHKSRPKRELTPEELADRQKIEDRVAAIATKRRAEKCIQRFIDDGLIPEDWDEHNLREISKLLPKAMFEDCRKEEPETVMGIEDFGKICSKLSMNYAKEAIYEEKQLNKN